MNTSWVIRKLSTNSSKVSRVIRHASFRYLPTVKIIGFTNFQNTDYSSHPVFIPIQAKGFHPKWIDLLHTNLDELKKYKILIIQFSMAPFQTVPTNALESVNSSLNDLKSNQGHLNEEDVRFGRNVRVIDHSAPYPIQVEPTMAVLSTGRILVGWKEAQTHSGPGYRVGFAYSTDEGHTFSPNILMVPTTPGHRQSDPWLVADHQDNAYFVFLDFADVEAGASGIGVAKTTDGGDTWLPTVDASDTPGFDDKETACVDAQGVSANVTFQCLSG